MEILQTKSILAKLMATENLHVEQRNVATASFDVENRILTIPVLDKNISNDEYDLFVGHEVGHALWTSYGDLKSAMDKKLSMTVVNIIEDSRIERKIKAKYPGLRHSFIKGYRALMEKDFFEVKYQDVNALPFMDRLNLHCKGGVEMNIRFTDEEMKLVDEVESTQTFADVLEVYKKLMKYAKEEESEERKKKKISISDDSSEDLENSEDQEGEGSMSDENHEMEIEISGENGDGQEGDEGEKGSNAEESQGTAGGGQRNEEISDEEIKAKTYDALNRNQNKLFSKEKKMYHYANIPTFDLSKAVVDHETIWNRYDLDTKTQMNTDYYAAVKDEYEKNIIKAYQDFRKNSKKVVSYLVKEFELRKNADQLKRASVAKTGELNMSKIYSYNFSEDIFKRITVVPGGKSHGLLMYIDWSGSMSNMIHETIEQLLNLVMFCKKVNIPYEVYAFTSEYDQTYHKKTPGEMEFSHISLMNLLSSRMNAKQFSRAAGVLLNYKASGRFSNMVYIPRWMCLGGTPLNEAAIAAMDMIPQFKNKYKLQNVNAVFLTDGDGNRVTSYYTPAGQKINPSGDSVIVLRDKKTGHEEHVSANDWASAMTSAYMNLLKFRTNCNIVGFYILPGRDFSSAMYRSGRKIDNEEMESMKKEFRKNNYKIITNSGYDEYYLLRHEGFSEDEEEFEVDEDASMRSLATAFVKYNMSRKTSRVILGRFIGMIA